MTYSASARPMGMAAAIVLALAGALAAPALAQDYKALGANLNGKGFQGGGEAEDGGGDFDGEIDFGQSQLCYYLDVDNIGAPTGAMIRKGKGDAGDPVTLELPLPAEDGDEACAKAEGDVLHAIAEHPGDYYVDIHTADFSDAAAVRGHFSG